MPVVHEATIKADGDDLFIVLPDDVSQRLDIVEGDVLEWAETRDGSFIVAVQHRV